MKEDNNQEGLSEQMTDFLKEQELKSQIQAMVDAARELGLENYTEEDALKALQEESKKGKDERE